MFAERLIEAGFTSAEITLIAATIPASLVE
jgi:hypothetical protein